MLACWDVSISTTQYYKEYASFTMVFGFFPLKFMKIKKTSFHIVDFEHEVKGAVPISKHVLGKTPLVPKDCV